MRHHSRLVLLVWLLAAAACATGTAGREGTGAPRRDQYLIRLDELRASRSSDLLYAVLSLRPYWFNKRGPVSFNSKSEIIVYLDNQRYGTDASLRSIDLFAVERLQFLPPPLAQARFGVGHPHGAILVFTRRGGRDDD